MQLEYVYSERVWLPGDVRWKQLQRGDSWYLHVVPWLALLLLLLRCAVRYASLTAHCYCSCTAGVCFSCVAAAAGRSLGVSGKNCSQPPSNDVLLTAFACNKRPTVRQVEALAGQVGWPPHRVQKWMHRARNWQKPSTLMKFRECRYSLL